MSEAKPRKVVCPHCGSMSLFTPANPWRPFCSERCKMIDLGAWASDSYRIPVESAEDPDVDRNEQADKLA